MGSRIAVLTLFALMCAFPLHAAEGLWKQAGGVSIRVADRGTIQTRGEDGATTTVLTTDGKLVRLLAVSPHGESFYFLSLEDPIGIHSGFYEYPLFICKGEVASGSVVQSRGISSASLYIYFELNILFGRSVRGPIEERGSIEDFKFDLIIDDDETVNVLMAHKGMTAILTKPLREAFVPDGWQIQTLAASEEPALDAVLLPRGEGDGVRRMIYNGNLVSISPVENPVKDDFSGFMNDDLQRVREYFDESQAKPLSMISRGVAPMSGARALNLDTETISGEGFSRDLKAVRGEREERE